MKFRFIFLLVILPSLGFCQEAKPGDDCEIYTKKNQYHPTKRRQEIAIKEIDAFELNKDSVRVVKHYYKSDKIDEEYIGLATYDREIGAEYLVVEVRMKRGLKSRIIRVTDPDVRIYLLNCNN